MSEPNGMNRLIERLSGDDALRARVLEKGSEALRTLAAEEGLALNDEQMHKVLEALPKYFEPDGSLTDEALDAIAGGTPVIRW